MKNFLLIIFTALLLMQSGCNQTRNAEQNDEPETDVISMESLAQGTMGGYIPADSRDETKVYAIRDESGFNELWENLHRQVSNAEKPDIDFSQNMIVAAFMGEKPSSGFEVRIITAEEEGERLLVQINERRPGPECMVMTVITSPYHVVKVPVSEKELEVRVTEEVDDCG